MVIPQRLHGKDNNTLKQKQLSYAYILIQWYSYM